MSKMNTLMAQLKPWMLPIAMIVGILARNHIGRLTFLAPYLIFVMLFVTFCKINPREFKITRMSLTLLPVQVLGALAVYWIVAWYDPTVAQGLFICIFCPTATAAPVITGMLGGSVTRLATYSIVSNMAVALLAPVLFPLVSSSATAPEFMESLSLIASKIGPLLIAPLLLSLIIGKVSPKLKSEFGRRADISFYLWAVSLILVVGSSVSFAMSEPLSAVPEMCALALGAGVVCLGQFGVGRILGRRAGDKIVGTQGLGQKNTVLAIWMALNWLDPMSSIAPAAYIAWQNTINSIQLVKKRKRDLSEAKTKIVA